MSLSNGKETIDNRSFGRRAFLKGTAAALGLAAVSGTGCAPKPEIEKADDRPEPPEEQIYQGVCRGNCGGGCRMNVHVREGKVVKTSVIEADDPLDTRLCQRGLSQAQRIYDPDRVQYPMRRVEGTDRGSGEWERLTWEEAISYITDKWKGYIEEFGGTSITMNYGAGTYAYNQYVYQHLFNRFGGVNWDSGYDMAALNVGKRLVGRGIYLHGNDCADVKNAKHIFCWGSNGSVAQITRWVYIREAVKNGAKIIVIDPVFTDIAERADIWVPIKPGTDVALALAMLKVIIDEGLQDDSYLARMTVAPFLVKEDRTFLRMSDLGVAPTEGPAGRDGIPTMIDPVAVCAADGTFGSVEEIADPQIRGTFIAQGLNVATAFELLAQHVAEWTPEKSADICEIEASTIVELAHRYADGPTSLEIGFGMDHRSHGAEGTHAAFCLPMVTGQMGKTGAGITGTMGGSTMGTHCVNFKAGLYPQEPVPTTHICIDKLPEIVEKNTYGDKTITPKSLLFFCGNTISNISGRTDLLKALEGIELIVTIDTVMNDTARFSDVILPVPHWFEYETFITCPTPFAEFNEKAVEPPFECKTDVEIVRLLAEGLGYDSSPYQNDVYQSLFLQGEASEAWGLSWEALKEKKYIQVCPIPYLFGNPDDEEFSFSTDTGRAEFYLEKPRPWFDIGQEFDSAPWHLPSYQPTTEAYNPDNPLNAKYPLNIISQRDRMKVHTQFSTHPWLMDIQPEPTLSINQTDADARGIAENDYVRAYNDRGSVVLKAHLDAGMRPGMVKTEHTWWDKQYVEGSYPSLLPLAQGTFSPGVHPFDTLCEVEKTTIS